MKSKQFESDLEYIAKEFRNNDIFSEKQILITGAAGFLGFNFTHFFLYLLEKGIPIRSLLLLDNFILGQAEWIRKIKHPLVEVCQFDIAKDKLNLPGIEQVDFIIHLASIASPPYYRKFPIQTMDANIWGLRNLLECYKEHSIKGFLFFSSSEIYGDPVADFFPTQEDYRGNVACIGPRACYDESKRFGETLCYLFAKEYQLPITVVRPFNNYGPGMNLNDKRVPADFAKAVLQNNDLVIHSDGSPTRTFCYVADAMVGYLKALVHDKFDYFNIGIDRPEISIYQLAEIYREIAVELLTYQGQIRYQIAGDPDYLIHNPSRRVPDISKAKQKLDYRPQITVEEGVRRYLRFLKESGE